MRHVVRAVLGVLLLAATVFWFAPASHACDPKTGEGCDMSPPASNTPAPHPQPTTPPSAGNFTPPGSRPAAPPAVSFLPPGANAVPAGDFAGGLPVAPPGPNPDAALSGTPPVGPTAQVTPSGGCALGRREVLQVDDGAAVQGIQLVACPGKKPSVSDEDTALAIAAAILGLSALPTRKKKAAPPAGPDTSMCAALHAEIAAADALYNQKVTTLQSMPIDSAGRETALAELNAARARQATALAALQAHPQCMPS
ncbi:MAG TPA: hypothetical protein VFB78_16410 [Acidimicrobiales bacterium]|nr:hypothetical protein [Acidimicrobiales bacterium]